MRSVLIPIDGSKTATRALKYVISTAQDGCQLDIHLVNVQQDVPPIGDLTLVDIELIEKSQRKYSEKVLRNACKLLNKAGLKCHQKILFSPIAKNIINYAAKNGCDSIVMGTRGMGMLGAILLGSTANQVVHLAKIPVTLVK